MNKRTTGKIAGTMRLFEKLPELIMELKADKWLHIIVGLIIFVIALAFLPIQDENLLFGVSWIITAFAGAFKEIVIDKWFNLGTPELADFLFTISIPTLVMAGQFGWPLIKIIGKLI